MENDVDHGLFIYYLNQLCVKNCLVFSSMKLYDPNLAKCPGVSALPSPPIVRGRFPSVTFLRGELGSKHGRLKVDC